MKPASMLALALLLGTPMMAPAQQKATPATGAILRVLEKVNGQVFDFDMDSGTSQEVGRMVVTLRACRYPSDNPTGDAFAFVTITERDVPNPLFEGWMIASSPALNALEHPRYDVWVLRCRTE